MWLSGNYPRALDGPSHSVLMRVSGSGLTGREAAQADRLHLEPSATSWPSCQAPVAAQNWPSTVAYLVALIIHRYAMLGVLDEDGISDPRDGHPRVPRDTNEPKLMQGALRNECGNYR